MNTPLQNQLLRGGNSGSGSAEVLRAASATARQAQPALLGADDTALHFKRMLSEYKQSEPTAAPTPHAAPSNSGSSQPGSVSARKDAAAPSPATKQEDKMTQDARLQTRRIQARANDQAQNAKAEGGKPAAASLQNPSHAPGATGAAVEGQVAEEDQPVCPTEDTQLNTSQVLDFAQLRPRAQETGGHMEPSDHPLAGGKPERRARSQDSADASVALAALQTGAVVRTETEAGDAPEGDADPSAQPPGPLQLNRQAATTLTPATGPGEPLTPASRASPIGESASGPKASRSLELGRLDRSAGSERGRAEPSSAVAESPAFSTAAPGQLSGSEAVSSFAQELRGALTASVPAGTTSAADTSHGLDRFESTSRNAGEPTTFSMTQGLHEASFAPELGARLSVLAADGVQEAQLHLNPAEMGPVAIQIVLEGQQAQISFHAEHAETRQVLEQGLPDLAAALRDAGLTLSGGGVFEQARGRSGQEQAGGKDEASRAKSARSITLNDASASLAGVTTSARRSQGVLDLYA
ncbi:flagellar hook-length control protein FliK [Paucibacter sp. DJ1R-11]|uniref:flagellar hook-length control protein FliK n=1 Tax=Paucibacter sp. DJ1R-11 TaxID=2893556 RepID=UPI0021E39BFD|nr:flagellar hook-length control protein FliK [Paucibacter sp. DJ1R-11]MCV2366257.1 flagellar hook-length control protein FliK [Paucibacter sp. DJ1R-11]